MLTARDLQRLKEIIESGRADPENPEYKIIKILCDELDSDLTDDARAIMEQVCNY
jgi:hypothetical protein